MRSLDLTHLERDDIEALVWRAAADRGRSYARGRVLSSAWLDDEQVLQGKVIGRGGLYATTVLFEHDRFGLRRPVTGRCSCPVGLNCKHVAALLLAWKNTTPAAPAGVGRAAPRPEWERVLEALVRPPAAAAGTPLALELSLQPPPASALRHGHTPGLRLVGRIMRPGKNGWINGGLTWDHVDGWRARTGDHRPEHLRVLRELRAAHMASVTQVYTYGFGPTTRDLNLTAVGAQLWPVLDEAARVGVTLLVSPGGGPLGVDEAEVVLDVTSPDQAGWRVAPHLRVTSGDDRVAVAFLGDDGHGVVHVARAERDTSHDPRRWPWRLARLAVPATAELRQLLLDERQVDVPAADHARFSADLWPRLRQVATVASSDGTFTAPAISGPTLGLHVAFEAEHGCRLRWSWVYRVDGRSLDYPLDAGDDSGCRDREAETALLADLDVDLGAYRLCDPAGRLLPTAALSGMDTVRLTEELLPLLEGRPDVTVERDGVAADFREVGDSLVIGVSADADARQSDWFDLGVTITADGREVPFTEVFRALAAGDSHMLLADGAYFSLEKPELQALARLIEEARALQESPSGPLRLSRFQADLWGELAALGVVTRQAEAWRRQVAALLADDPIDAPPVPAGLRATLRPYQEDGFGWLAFLWRHDLGGILADDMGLGKTLQTLALVCHARRTRPDAPPFLVLAPTSVVSNWSAEAARFAPELSVVTVDCTLARAGCDIDEIASGADVVVTSYAVFRLDADAYSSRPWAGLVLDEAQMAKNHRSKLYGCIRKVSTPFKLAVTGTPLENNLLELWSLLSMTAPGLFPDVKRFEEYYARPIQRHGDAELLARLRRRIRPLVLRRTKEQVASELPAKQEQVLAVELQAAHARLYQRQLQRERQHVLGLLDDLDRNRFTILRSLTVLRQLSLHAGLVDDRHASVGCAKLDTLVEHLVEVADGGHRALVFSQFTRFLALVRKRLDAEGIEHCYLDGATRKRADVVQRFKDGAAPVFCISLKAGGFGLNLVEADYVFLLDPWWNPATEAQAIDRTHRIGQSRNVMVYRLIARDTIEEKVLALAQRKAELFAGVMADGEPFSGALSRDDILALVG